MKTVKIKWSVTRSFLEYFQVPDDFDQENWEMEERLSDYENDADEIEVGEIEVYDDAVPLRPGKEPAPVLELTGFEKQR